VAAGRQSHPRERDAAIEPSSSPMHLRILISLVLGSAILAGCSPVPAPSVGLTSSIAAPSLEATPSSFAAPSITPTGTPVPSPVEVVTCLPFDGDLRPGLDGDPCPSALKAIRATVLPLGFLVSRVYVAPQPFTCGSDLWPGVTSPPICFGPFTEPGAWMHGWVAFADTDRVAALELSRLGRADASHVPPWRPVLKAFAVPPDGWEMP
jgi:hypothetical protein